MTYSTRVRVPISSNAATGPAISSIITVMASVTATTARMRKYACGDGDTCRTVKEGVFVWRWCRDAVLGASLIWMWSAAAYLGITCDVCKLRGVVHVHKSLFSFIDYCVIAIYQFVLLAQSRGLPGLCLEQKLRECKQMCCACRLWPQWREDRQMCSGW